MKQAALITGSAVHPDRWSQNSRLQFHLYAKTIRLLRFRVKFISAGYGL
jgi:hypothetical protein